MKNIFLVIIALLAFGTDASANYYRVFQGTRRADFTADRYITSLPAFLRGTIQLYEVDNSILNSYLVAVPPRDKPDFVPDEFALVDLTSQAEYNAVRATEAGKAYADSHWDVFERSLSASVPYQTGPNLPESISAISAFDVFGAPVRWREGHTTFFLGVKRSGLSQEEYYSGMLAHVKHVASAFAPKGLLGYIVVIAPQYEIAFMNWRSEEAANAAFASREGEIIRNQSNALLYFLQFSSAKLVPAFSTTETGQFVPALNEAKFGDFYSVLKTAK